MELKQTGHYDKYFDVNRDNLGNTILCNVQLHIMTLKNLHIGISGYKRNNVKIPQALKYPIKNYSLHDKFQQ